MKAPKSLLKLIGSNDYLRIEEKDQVDLAAAIRKNKAKCRNIVVTFLETNKKYWQAYEAYQKTTNPNPFFHKFLGFELFDELRSVDKRSVDDMSIIARAEAVEKKYIQLGTQVVTKSSLQGQQTLAVNYGTEFGTYTLQQNQKNVIGDFIQITALHTKLDADIALGNNRIVPGLIIKHSGNGWVNCVIGGYPNGRWMIASFNTKEQGAINYKLNPGVVIPLVLTNISQHNRNEDPQISCKLGKVK